MKISPGIVLNVEEVPMKIRSNFVSNSSSSSFLVAFPRKPESILDIQQMLVPEGLNDEILEWIQEEQLELFEDDHEDDHEDYTHTIGTNKEEITRNFCQIIWNYIRPQLKLSLKDRIQFIIEGCRNEEDCIRTAKCRNKDNIQIQACNSLLEIAKTFPENSFPIELCFGSGTEILEEIFFSRFQIEDYVKLPIIQIMES